MLSDKFIYVFRDAMILALRYTPPGKDGEVARSQVKDALAIITQLIAERDAARAEVDRLAGMAQMRGEVFAELKAEMKAENVALRAEIARLHKLFTEPELVSVKASQEDGVEMEFRCDWAVKALAGSFAKSLDGAENWRAFQIGPIPSFEGNLIVTVQRADGETPVETLRGKDAEVTRLEAENAGLAERLRVAGQVARGDEATIAGLRADRDALRDQLAWVMGRATSVGRAEEPGEVCVRIALDRREYESAVSILQGIPAAAGDGGRS